MKFFTQLTVYSLLIMLNTGCGTLPNGRGWGQDASWPTWKRFKNATVNAAKNPYTWAPALGAVTIAYAELDEDIVENLAKDTPIFGSQENANKLSGDLRAALNGLTAATLLATPSGNQPGEWATAKFKGLMVEGGAHALTARVTHILKEETDGIRPNKSNDASFPSGHANSAFTNATLAARNIKSMNISETSKTVLNVGFKTMAIGVGWARVEANKHFPSDIMAAASISHFLTAIVYDTFMGLDESHFLQIQIDKDTAGLQLGWRF